MSTEQTLTPELDPGPVALGTRIRNLLAVPGRLLGVLVVPDRVMPSVVGRQRCGAAFLAIILCGLASAYVVGSRIDTGAAVLQEEAAMQKQKGAEFEARSDRELGEEIAKQRTIEQVKLGLGAGLGTPFFVLLLGIGMFLLARYVGGRPTFLGALSASAHAALPAAVKSLVVAAMAWPSSVLTSADAATLGRVAVLAPAGGPLMRFLSVDAFVLWSVILLVFGLAAAGQMSRRRSFITVFICFVLYQLLTGGAAGADHGPGPTMTGMPPGGTR
jgi:hypothetical protein